MKAWIVTPYEPLPLLGDAVRPYRCGMLAAAIAERGHSLHFWTSSFDHFARKDNILGCVPPAGHKNVSVECLSGCGYSRGASLRRVIHNCMLARDFEKKALAVLGKPDVVYTQIPSLELAEATIGISKRLGVPAVVDIRDPWPDVYARLLPKCIRPLSGFLFYSEYSRLKRILKGAAGVTAVSNTYLDWALKYSGRSRNEYDAVFPLGFPSDLSGAVSELERTAIRARYGIPANAFLVLFAGNFSSSLNLSTVIDAARLVSSKVPGKIFFMLAGSGDNLEFVRSRAKGVPNVILPGLLSYKELTEVLCSASLGIAPYSSVALQSLPNKPFEYMAAGLPILTSLNGELRSLVEAAGIGAYYPPDDHVFLADMLLELYRNPERVLNMAGNARAAFESKYKQKIVYTRFVEYLERVASSR